MIAPAPELAASMAYLGVPQSSSRLDVGPRRQLAELAVLRANRKQSRDIEARYDAAQDSDAMKNYWAAADGFDADSAHSPAVRTKLIQRSRYEAANNGYADGIAQTYATAVVGTGVKLRMQTASTGFNQMVEFEWDQWCKAVNFRRKLWCMTHAKHVDGEGIGVVRNNPNSRHAIKLDIQLVEADQMATPQLMYGVPGYIDGIQFDDFGNPVIYDLLRRHPGSNGQGYSPLNDVEHIPARFMLHWYMMRRPGQHRGVPEMSSTLNDGASFRRWREACLAAAETAADLAAILETDMPPGDADPAQPFTTIDFQKGMLMANPMGWKTTQMKAEHPNATYEAFHRSLVSGQARPKNMPYNVAACDSSSYNYASGRLDYQIWHSSLDVDREDCNDLVLDPLFDLWFDEAIRVYGWLGGRPSAIGSGARIHKWQWPKHKVADIEAEANSIQTRLRSGQASLGQVYDEQGEDFEDEIQRMAKDYGVDEATMRRALLLATLNSQNQQASVMTAEAQKKQADTNAKRATQPKQETPNNGTQANN